MKQQYSLQDIRILEDLGYRVAIATSLREVPWNCDLYLSWFAAGSVLPLIKARLARKPIIVIAGGNDSMFYRDSVSGRPRGYLSAPWYKKVAARLSLRHGTKVLVVSKFMVDDVMALGARRPIVIPNSVNTALFSPSNAQRLHVTTMFDVDEMGVNIKRGEIFLRAAPIVLGSYPEQTFIIIGEKGNAHERLLALARELGVESSVQFLGSIDNTDAARWLQQSKIYVQISDTETFGVAIAEAMSSGTPVVVSRRGAIPELAEDHGVYVDQNDPRSVAAGILSLLKKTEEERRSIGAAARNRIVEHYSYEKRRAAIRHVIEEISTTETQHDPLDAAGG